MPRPKASGSAQTICGAQIETLKNDFPLQVTEERWIRIKHRFSDAVTATNRERLQALLGAVAAGRQNDRQ